MTKMEEVAFNVMRLINIVDGEHNEDFKLTLNKAIRTQIVNGEDWSELVYRIESEVCGVYGVILRRVMEIDKDGIISSLYWDGEELAVMVNTTRPEEAVCHGFGHI